MPADPWERLFEVARRFHKIVFGRGLEKDVQQIHVPRTEDDKNSVGRFRIYPLDVPEDSQVPAEPLAGHKIRSKVWVLAGPEFERSY